MSASSRTPRRVKTPGWLDLRLILGLALVLASVALGARLIGSARHTDAHLAVTRDLAAGSMLRAEDVEVVQVKLPVDGFPRYVSDSAAAMGKELNRPLSAGELLPISALGERKPATTVSVPLPLGSAPSLNAGQRIKLWLSTKSCRSIVLLADATVQAVDQSRSSFSGGAGHDVVLSLPRELADRVVDALALDDAHIRAGVLSGTSPSDASDRLPALSGCAAKSQGSPSQGG